MPIRMSKRKCKRSGVRSLPETPGCGKLRQARTIIVALCLSCFAATTFPIAGDDHGGLPNYDVRNDKDKLGLVTKSSKAAKKKKSKLRKKAGNGEATLAITAPGAKTTLDSETGVPTRITSIKGVLKAGS